MLDNRWTIDFQQSYTHTHIFNWWPDIMGSRTLFFKYDETQSFPHGQSQANIIYIELNQPHIIWSAYWLPKKWIHKWLLMIKSASWAKKKNKHTLSNVTSGDRETGELLQTDAEKENADVTFYCSQISVGCWTSTGLSWFVCEPFHFLDVVDE